MTNTEKILEEFDEKFDRVVLENPFSETEELSNELLTLKKWAGLFLTTKITQALAEERERVGEKIEKLQNDGLNVIIEGDYYKNFRDVENILSSLNKPLTDKDKFVIEGCKFCGCGKRSEAIGGQGGNGACICSCHSTWNL